MFSDSFWLLFGKGWLLLALCLLAVDPHNWRRYLRSVILSGTVLLTATIVHLLHG